MPIVIREQNGRERAWIAECLEKNWGGARIVTRGVLHDALELPALVAEFDGCRAGLITYRVDGPNCEVMSLDVSTKGVGIGTALIEDLAKRLKPRGCKRLWLVTSNDNLEALRFYQRRGFVLVAVHRRAIEYARSLKPSIPLLGNHGIPIRDEIELERTISP